MRTAIIGAGMAGLACADSLRQAGHSVHVFDKGRGPGGRMSTRRMATPLGDVSFDHGAQYFTVRDPEFRATVERWSERQVAAPWPDAAPDAWVGSPGMNAVIKHMAADHAVSWSQQISGLVRRDRLWHLKSEAGDSGPFDCVALAIPAEQAAPILSLHEFAMARIALMARSRPCWTSMFVFDRILADLPAIIRTGGDIVWATRNSAKPGHSGPEAWVVQANASWTQANIDLAQEAVSATMLAALGEAAGCVLPGPVAAMSHRWRFALSTGTGDGALWQPDIGLGACGDWLLGPRVESAWLSGRMLAAHILGQAAPGSLDSSAGKWAGGKAA